MGVVLDSKANLTTYCLDVAKQLQMHYQAPPLPVHVTYRNDELGPGAAATLPNRVRGDQTVPSPEQLTESFRHAAVEKHNIVC